MTDAVSSTLRSAVLMRSNREASSAWMVGGTAMASASMVSRHPSASATSTPSCTSMATSSRTKSGFPPVDDGSRESNSVGSLSVPRTRAASSVVAPGSRPPSRIASPTHPPTVTNSGLLSRNSGRPSAIISTGASRTHSDRCSTKSSKRASAH
ncbi:MAG: hypothetical protein U0R66_13495 [Mycobacterium sp.]